MREVGLLHTAACCAEGNVEPAFTTSFSTYPPRRPPFIALQVACCQDAEENVVATLLASQRAHTRLEPPVYPAVWTPLVASATLKSPGSGWVLSNGVMDPSARETFTAASLY